MLKNNITQKKIILNPNFKSLSKEDKSNLKARIANSIEKESQRIKRKRFSIISFSMEVLISLYLLILSLRKIIKY
ncbi:hypothetical protein EAH81_06075 [Flavobacterium pectinovorum]|uniref:Uncharacterized protein n=1 Tax=Flavobacterium pectinovorum TaxID=29533 RepID=A0A502F603_9FLAO|nr:hypothetical protein EAH81_06075 [Flavobacterium pectinovorum]